MEFFSFSVLIEGVSFELGSIQGMEDQKADFGVVEVTVQKEESQKYLGLGTRCRCELGELAILQVVARMRP